jgi:hypothetical protein
MKQTAVSFGVAGMVWALVGSAAPAQTVIRAPFVRVETGGPYGGTYVRAPFVRLFTGGPPPVYYGTPPIVVPPYGPNGPMVGPGIQITPPFVSPAPGQSSPPNVPSPPRPLPSTQEPPLDDRPRPAPENLPPANVLQEPVATTSANVLSFDQFVKSFQPKAGSYEIAVLNPLTKQPTTVRFALPPGSPERVLAGQSYLEYRYAGRQFVRIEFDRDGATVISR